LVFFWVFSHYCHFFQVSFIIFTQVFPCH
jgi:hypothetical protein